MQQVILPSLPLPCFSNAYAELEINDPEHENFKPLLPEEILRLIVC